MSESSALFESLKKEIDELAEKLKVPSVLIMKSLSGTMKVEASGGKLESTYPIGAEGKKSTHEHGDKPLYCERVVDNNAELFIKDSKLDKDFAGNEDEVEFGLSNYLGIPLHHSDGSVFGTVCVLSDEAREYTDEEKELLKELRRKAEQLLR